MNAVLAIEDATCAARNTVCHCMPPPMAFSGTTTVSPGRNSAFKESPPHSPWLEPRTEPSARITKIAFLLANWVGPPDWPRYQFALFPERYEMAVGLKTWPLTIT